MVHAFRIFKKYNTNKIAFLYEQLPPRKRMVFNLVPLLFHLEAGDLLGHKEVCSVSPHGIYGYEIGPEAVESFESVFPERSLPVFRYRASFDPGMPIKAVGLIGSLGSVAQNSNSDFDYWICIDTDLWTDSALRSFRFKLELIEQWAQRTGEAEVHCFPIDINRLREASFGDIRGDSSGTAQGKLLVEELYRSLTLVAGKIPLWWIMPPGVDDADYTRLKEIVSRSHRLDHTQLVDTGNIYEISLGEFYGAAIWHINKTIGSPFKSILKLAVLEEYLVNQGRNGTLCDELKRRLQNRIEDAYLLDPYVLIFDRASDYLTEQGRLEHLELLRRALYMKSGVKITQADHRQAKLPRKKEVIIRLIRKWGWNQQTLDKLNNQLNWSFQETLEFNRQINRFIMETYRRVAAEHHRHGRDVDLVINKRDLTVLSRKLYVFYSRRAGKVETIRSVIQKHPVLPAVTLQCGLDKDQKREWVCYRGIVSRESIEQNQASAYFLTRSTRLTGILIWLTTNQLYDRRTSVHINPAAGGLDLRCTAPDIIRLLDEMAGFFSVLKYYCLSEQELLQDPRTQKVLLVINLEDPDRIEGVAETEICSQNNWGEIFFGSYPDPRAGLEEARNLFWEQCRVNPDQARSNFKIFLPPRQFSRTFLNDLNNALGFKAVD